ncbi:phage tail tape measure protein [Wukongibacter sp. M2B1]|uniref:phage tail tape measure protein n=1 Tax=Wukongibacter sp. M2B1 TaxID=3088895 RepID=UPI003D796012
MNQGKEVNVIVDAKNKSKRSFLEVRRDLKDLDRETRRGTSSFSRNFAKMDKSVATFSNKLKFMDKIAKRTFQGTAAAASIYVATTMRDFSQLTDGVSKVNTMYDQTRQSQAKMVKDSLQMYRLIPTDFSNITQGIYDSMSSGVDSRYASMTSRKFGQASVAGMTQLPTVTKAATGTMNAFKQEVKDLDHILDVQFLTVKNGIVEYEQLASSLGTGVLKSADSAGIEMEELYTSIAGITKNAIPANIATTSLMQLFNKFTDTKALKEFKEFGVSIRNSKNETRPLIEIFKDLNEQFDKRGMNKERRASFLKEILGSDEAVRALQPLLGDLKDFEKILNQMENSSGAMQNAFEDRLDNINTQAKLMWNNIKAYGVEQLLTFEPFFDALMGPTIERQKLTFRKLDLEDSLEFEKDPQIRKMARMEIGDVQKQIDQIDLTPIDSFREALSESTDKLREINPILANIIDTVGGFLMNFVGKEGEGWRKGAKYTGYTLGSLYGAKKLGDMFLWFRQFGEVNKKGSPAETLSQTMRTMNVNANIVNVYGKSINNRGGRPGIGGPSSFPSGGPVIIPTNPATPLPPTTPPLALPGGTTGTVITAAEKAAAQTLLETGSIYSSFWSMLPASLMGLGGKKEISDSKIQQLSLNRMESNDAFTRQLIDIPKQMDNINRQVNLRSNINVEPPKMEVKVFVDGKQIPVKVDYNSIRRVVNKDFLVQSRRYGKD